MNVILAKMPRYYPSYFEENSESLALGYLSAYLRKKGFNVSVFDASLESLSLEKSKQKILNLAKKEKPILIGLTIADMTFIESTIDTIQFLKKNGVKAHITMGGHSPTFSYKNLFEFCPELDSIIMYEGERALFNLLKALENEKEWKRLPNIVWKENGKIIVNPPLPLIEDIDELPFPSRDYLPYVLSNLNRIGVVPIASSRGCYMNCGFCSIRRFYDVPKGSLWRGRSAKNIVKEIKEIKNKFPEVVEFVIIDDAFSGPPKQRKERMLLIKNELKRNNLQIMISTSDRVDVVDEDLGKLWKEMGVRQILLGLESGSQEILNIFNKSISLTNQKRALNILEKFEIDTAISYINFTPWSTLEQIEKNVKYFLSLNINMIQGMLNRFQIYDGTPLAEKLRAQKLLVGKFPNERYRTPDERVDILYEIVSNSFNPYLFIAYRLKILERELRIAFFTAEMRKDFGSVRIIRKYTSMYKEMMKEIMKEATELFLETLDMVRMGMSNTQKPKGRIEQKVKKKTDKWFQMIETFRTLCPALEKGGTYVKKAN